MVLTVVLAGGLPAEGGTGPSPSPGGAPEVAGRRVPAATPVGQWLAGDNHVHTDHSSDGSLPRQATDQRGPGTTGVADQIDDAETRQLDWVPITDHRTYDQHYDPEWTSDQLVLIPGEEANAGPHATVQGAIGSIHDGPAPADAPLRPLQQSIWEAHGQGANWGTAHPDDGELNDDRSPNANASAIGIDVVEVWNRAAHPDQEIDYAENRWNAGFRFGVVGASDSHFREITALAGPGSPATFVFSGDGSERAILQALRAGRTTVSADKTSGVFATLEGDFDGDGAFEALGGDEVMAAQGATGTLRVRVQRGIGTRVLLYRSPGRSATPLAEVTPTTADETFAFPVTVQEGDSWYRVEVRGTAGPSGVGTIGELDQLQAATSPIFVSTGAFAVPNPEIDLPPPRAGTDTAAAVIGAPGVFAGFADVATAQTITHVVAETHGPGRTAVVYRRVDSDAPRAPDPTAEIDLAPNSDSARFPKIAVSGDDVWVAWQDERTGQTPRRPDIYLRHSRDGGQTWEAETLLTGDGDGRAEHPSLALLDGDTPVVAWQDNRRGPFDVWARVGLVGSAVNLTADKPFTPRRPGDTRSARYPASLHPSVAVGPEGQLAIAWHDDRSDPDPLFTGRMSTPENQDPDGTVPDDWEILVARRSAGGTDWSGPVNVTPTAAPDERRADRHPSLVFDGTGRLVAAWDSSVLRSADVGIGLRASRSPDDGATWSVPEPVVPDADVQRRRPSLGLDPDGTVRAVWYDSGAADWRWSIGSALLGATGWSDVGHVTSAGNATFGATEGGELVFTSDRFAARAQRDVSERVLLMELAAEPEPPPDGGEDPDPDPDSTPDPSPDLSGAPSPSPTGEDPSPDREDAALRVSGSDRIATAIAASESRYPSGGAESVILARADVFADALAGTPLAARLEAPLLLTGSTGLDPRVEAELQRVLGGPGRVVLLGGAVALAPAVEARVVELGHGVVRHAGPDRFGTAVAIAGRGLGNPGTLLLATGRDFPDALAGGAAAAEAGAAVLLTDGATNPAATRDYVSAHPTAERFAIGGPAAAADPTATAVAGTDRFDTAAEVARRFFRSPQTVGLASGGDFPDALSGGAHGAAEGAPLLLVLPSDVPAATQGYLTEHRGTLSRAYVYGGPAAVEETVLDQVLAAIN